MSLAGTSTTVSLSARSRAASSSGSVTRYPGTTNPPWSVAYSVGESVGWDRFPRKRKVVMCLSPSRWVAETWVVPRQTRRPGRVEREPVRQAVGSASALSPGGTDLTSRTTGEPVAVGRIDLVARPRRCGQGGTFRTAQRQAMLRAPPRADLEAEEANGEAEQGAANSDEDRDGHGSPLLVRGEAAHQVDVAAVDGVPNRFRRVGRICLDSRPRC